MILIQSSIRGCVIKINSFFFSFLDIQIELLASTTNGFVAADITALCREAAMHAVERANHTSTQ